ncbi:MAG: linear amide C-N hydrolase [Oligoflexia bacterium]|nr:linear amide C-N hydrolase [Oligoflexia bacterium]
MLSMIKILPALITLIITTITTILPPALACTTFLMTNANNNTSGAFFGKDYDWHIGQGIIYINKRGVAKRAIVSKQISTAAKWNSRYGSLTFNQYGREFPNGGMNEKGLVVEIMVLDGSKFPSKIEFGESINELQWIQYQLDNFSSVKQMIKQTNLLNIIPMYGSLHFLACDRSRDCATFEYLNGKWTITSGEKLKVKTLANSSYADSVTNLSRYVGFGGRGRIPNDSSSLSRFVRASHLALQFKPTTTTTLDEAINYGFQILSSVALSNNKWQIIYDLDNLMVYFKSKKTNCNKTKYIDLKTFDMSCARPVLAHQLESTLSGNISSNFKSFNYQENRELIRSSLSQMPTLPIANPVAILSDLPQTFECNSLL